MEWLSKSLMTIIYWLFFWLCLGLTEETMRYAAVMGIFYQSFEELKQLLKK